MTHTPGPWKYDTEHADYHVYSENGLRPIVAFCPKGFPEANARLIAAAPEMLEALKDMLRLIEEHGSPVMKAHATRIMAARGTISKVEANHE